MARVAGGKKFDKLNTSRVYFGNWLRFGPPYRQDASDRTLLLTYELVITLRPLMSAL